MTGKQIIKRAVRITIAHAYDDGTYLYDILVGDKVYTVRTYPHLLEEAQS